MDELTARRHGKVLLRRMKGTGWKLEVWENLGWHYCVVNGNLTVYASEYMDGISYTALLGDEGPHAGLPLWSSHFSSKDPNEVARNQLEIAEDTVKRLTTVVKKVRANIGPKKK